MNNKETVSQKIMGERQQRHGTRKKFYEELEEDFGMSIIALYTSFKYPVMIEDDDAQMLQDILQRVDLSEGLCLIVSSPGGQILSAERIINICRNYSSENEYCVIVPEKAKSAATMICFGAKKIFVGENSELGPVGPQITKVIDGEKQRLSVKRMVDGYDDLFKRAINEEEGNLEPYLQQLQYYDERLIEELRPGIELAREITVEALNECMMLDSSQDEIRECIDIFLEPEKTRVHGRPIYPGEMEECNLNIERLDTNSDTWEYIQELHLRLDNFVSNEASKCIESKDYSFIATPPE